MAICNEQSPESLHYDTKMMRQHLAGCLEDQVFRHFPASKRTISQEMKKYKYSRFTAPAVCLKVERE